MRLLLDTHILLWTIAESRRLSTEARALIGDAGSEITFSVVTLWEVAIKTARRRADFDVEVSSLRRQLLDNSYAELAVSGAHAVALAILPPLHKDPFDRHARRPGDGRGPDPFDRRPGGGEIPGADPPRVIPSEDHAWSKVTTGRGVHPACQWRLDLQKYARNVA